MTRSVSPRTAAEYQKVLRDDKSNSLNKTLNNLGGIFKKLKTARYYGSNEGQLIERGES